MPQKTESKRTSVVKPDDGELPADLNFFKYAQGGSSKRKASDSHDSRKNEVEKIGKKRKMSDEEEQETREEEQDQDDEMPVPRHRVTTKGSKVPEHVDSFEALRQRYDIPSQLLSNLFQIGYTHPTGIQSYGIPILLEVSQCVGSPLYDTLHITTYF